MGRDFATHIRASIVTMWGISFVMYIVGLILHPAKIIPGLIFISCAMGFQLLGVHGLSLARRAHHFDFIMLSVSWIVYFVLVLLVITVPSIIGWVFIFMLIVFAREGATPNWLHNRMYRKPGSEFHI